MKHQAGSSGKGEVPLLVAGFKGLCPQCGAPGLFSAPVELAERCRSCGLSFAAYPVSGRPVAVLTLLLAGLVFALAMLVEETIYPPLWVQVTLWPIVTVAVVIAFLRMMKGAAFIRAWRRAKAGQDVTPESKADKAG